MTVLKLLFFTLVTWIISFLFEFLSASTGLITGSTYIHHAPGPYIGPIPVIIPFAWCAIIFLSIVITNLYLKSKKLITNIFSDICIALVFALIADPLAVLLGWWTWQYPGRYFGVPLGNFLLWVLVVGLTSFIYRRFIDTMKI